jgi:hypothetical protein
MISLGAGALLTTMTLHQKELYLFLKNSLDFLTQTNTLLMNELKKLH